MATISTGCTVRIGQAAALYDLAPSTLRWWEQQGVLGVPEHLHGRRQYGERELRRIGVAYLCHVTGLMPLQKTAVVTAGGVDVASWHRVIAEQVAELDRKLADIRAARDYLQHLLVCPGDDLTECPYLDAELSAHTPRGRITEDDVVAAARQAGR